MTHAVFFDFYGTVGRFDPPREKIQDQALAQRGLAVDREALVQAYPVADDFMARENRRWPLQERPHPALRTFYARYEQLLLHHAGLEVSLKEAMDLFPLLQGFLKGYTLFDDVLPTLDILKAQGYTLGLLSNLDEEMDPLVEELGLAPYLDFALTSREAGAPKPHPSFFRLALDLASVEPSRTVHVGDQYNSDVVGARSVGIHPILLDRDGHSIAPHDCPRVSTLTELLPLVKELSRLPSRQQSG